MSPPPVWDKTDIPHPGIQFKALRNLTPLQLSNIISQDFNILFSVRLLSWGLPANSRDILAFVLLHGLFLTHRRHFPSKSTHPSPAKHSWTTSRNLYSVKSSLTFYTFCLHSWVKYTCKIFSVKMFYGDSTNILPLQRIYKHLRWINLWEL